MLRIIFVVVVCENVENCLNGRWWFPFGSTLVGIDLAYSIEATKLMPSCRAIYANIE